jgi:DNA-binding HxlR family transcriptional regulator
MQYRGDVPQRTDFAGMACSIARSWQVIGEPWTPLVLRDLFVGLHRFEELRQDLGVATNVLAARLRTLEDAGVLERRPYRTDGRTRHEYHLTTMGRELVPVLAALTCWGDRWLSDGRPPAELGHEGCGGDPVRAEVTCSACGEPLTADGLRVRAGPGGRTGPGTAIVGALLGSEDRGTGSGAGSGERA